MTQWSLIPKISQNHIRSKKSQKHNKIVCFFSMKSFFRVLDCGVFWCDCGVFRCECGVFPRAPKKWIFQGCQHWQIGLILGVRAQSEMQQLPSRTDSSSTLLRGIAVLRQNTMSLEGDEQYMEMVAERNRLLEASHVILSSFLFSHEAKSMENQNHMLWNTLEFKTPWLTMELCVWRQLIISRHCPFSK